MAEKALCNIDGCGNRVRTRGMCQGHYLRLLRHGDPLAGGKMRQRYRGRVCGVDDCQSRAVSNGLCGKHQLRMRRHGDPTHTKRAANGETQVYLDDLLSAAHGDECIIWPYARNAQGYGVGSFGEGITSIASRLVCERVYGPPPGPCFDAAHSCGNGNLGCVNPRHLSWKTKSENQEDRVAHGTSNRGERCGAAKLTEKQVRWIRSMAGTMTHSEIGACLDVHRRTVGNIINRKIWAWLE